MQDIAENAPSRKVLSLKLQSSETPGQPCMVVDEEAVFMVWREGGPAPQRIYRQHERKLALGHAKALCVQTGARYHVLRSFRAFEKAGVEVA